MRSFKSMAVRSCVVKREPGTRPESSDRWLHFLICLDSGDRQEIDVFDLLSFEYINVALITPGCAKSTSMRDWYYESVKGCEFADILFEQVTTRRAGVVHTSPQSEKKPQEYISVN
jgi:hypothetical protein